MITKLHIVTDIITHLYNQKDSFKTATKHRQQEMRDELDEAYGIMKSMPHTFARNERYHLNEERMNELLDIFNRVPSA